MAYLRSVVWKLRIHLSGRGHQYHTATGICEPLFFSAEGKEFPYLLLDQLSAVSCQASATCLLACAAEASGYVGRIDLASVDPFTDL